MQALLAEEGRPSAEVEAALAEADGALDAASAQLLDSWPATAAAYRSGELAPDEPARPDG